MTYSAAYFLDASGEQLGDILRRLLIGLRGFLPTSETRQTVQNASLGVATVTPSLVAEMAPLFLLWQSHLPTWQMSAIMAASWAFTWWLTWTLILAVKNMGTVH